MFKVLDVFKVGNMLSATLDGKCDSLKNGSKLTDGNGNVYEVISVGMTRHDNPNDIAKSTTILVKPCNLEKGNELFIA